MSKVQYGGQALIEGVMMRGPGRMAIAVRRPDQQISVVEEDFVAWNQRYPALRLPIVRGVAAFAETISIGINALLYSANQSVGEDEQIGKGEMTLSVVLGLGLAILLFIVVPTIIMGFAKGYIGNVVLANLIEGGIRILFLLGYVWAISKMPDVRRVLQYHGAEHKTIHCLEAGEPLCVENVRGYSILHPRCSTAFLLFVAVISILLFSFLGWPGVVARIATRLAMLPVVAGLAYEVFKVTARIKWLGFATWPGLMLQRFTAFEPDDGQIEVAIAALEAVRTK